MARRKEMYLVIDTETTNSIEQPLPYDIGYAVCDRFGHIVLERSFVVAEIFLDHKEMMKSAYFAEKIPHYWEDIKNGTREIKSIFNIRKQIKEDMKKYRIKKVGAYNMAFDKRALNNVIRYCSKSLIRWFFPFGTEFFCIWSLATQTILQQKTFFKMAEKNNWFSECGNLKTNAEITYKYITKQIDFEEEHTGFEDVKIEVAILAHCIKQHKKMKWGIDTQCWRNPTKKYKVLCS